uniref:eIF3h C-terminal domain-containing protein n=1 Tax=Oryctolagus cuniculus TaxID=9986 RepID=A0A5F9DGA6_RABIT
MASRKEGTGSSGTSSSSATGAVAKDKGKGGSGDSAVKQVQIDGRINTYCQNIREFTAQNLGKLFMAQVLQDYNN